MNKLALILPYALLFILVLFFGAKWIEMNEEPRFIEVTGSAQMEVEPDEIHFVIGLREFWKDDYLFSTRSWSADPIKISLDSIENQLCAEFEKLGIKKDELIVNSTGNYWTYSNSAPLMNKEFELVLPTLSRVNEVIAVCNFRGIQYMRINEMTNSKITDYRKEVKLEAVRAAEEKAGYLLSAVDETKAELISITEINTGDYTQSTWYLQQAANYANALLNTARTDENNNIKKIQLHYEVNAKFAID